MSFLDNIKTTFGTYIAPTPPITPQEGGSAGASHVTQKQPGLAERMAAIDGRNSFGGINFAEGTAARIAAINGELQPKAFLGVTTDYYA